MDCSMCACRDCAQRDNCASCGCDGGGCTYDDPIGFTSECDDYEVDPYNEANWDYDDEDDDDED